MRSATARTTGTPTALPSIAYRLAREISLTSPLIIPYLVKSSGKPCKRSHSTSVSIRIRDFCSSFGCPSKVSPRLLVYQIIAEIGLFVIVTCYRSAGMGMNRVFPARMIPSTRRRERKYISGTPVCNTSDKVDSLSVLG